MKEKRRPKIGRVWDFRIQDDQPGVGAVMVTLRFFVLDASREEATQIAAKMLKNTGGE